MESVTLAIARSAIVDRETNLATLVEVIEDFQVPSIPMMLPQVAVYWLIRREQGEPAELDVELVLSNNDVQFGAFPLHVNFEGNTNFRSVINLQGLVVQEPGRLTFRFRRDGVEIANRSVIITLHPAVPVQATQPPATGAAPAA